jgi:hypothetical protein
MIDPAWINAGASVLGSVLKTPTPAPAFSGGTSSIAQDFDFSGFTVATGGSTATGAPNNKRTGGASASGGGGLLDGGGSMLPLLILGGAALAAFALWPR